MLARELEGEGQGTMPATITVEQHYSDMVSAALQVLEGSPKFLQATAAIKRQRASIILAIENSPPMSMNPLHLQEFDVIAKGYYSMIVDAATCTAFLTILEYLLYINCHQLLLGTLPEEHPGLPGYYSLIAWPSHERAKKELLRRKRQWSLKASVRAAKKTSQNFPKPLPEAVPGFVSVSCQKAPEGPEEHADLFKSLVRLKKVKRMSFEEEHKSEFSRSTLANYLSGQINGRVGSEMRAKIEKAIVATARDVNLLG